MSRTVLKPTARQLEFMDWEFGAFFHFGSIAGSGAASPGRRVRAFGPARQQDETHGRICTAEK